MTAEPAVTTIPRCTGLHLAIELARTLELLEAALPEDQLTRAPIAQQRIRSRTALDRAKKDLRATP